MRVVNSFAREPLSGLAIAGGSSTAVPTARARGAMRTFPRMPVFALLESTPRPAMRALAPCATVGADANAPSADIVSSVAWSTTAWCGATGV